MAHIIILNTLYKRPDGSSHWMNSSGLTNYKKDRNLAFMTGVIYYITKRENYETKKDDILSMERHKLKTLIKILKAGIQLLERLKNKPIHEKIPKLIEQSVKSIEKIKIFCR